MKRKAMKRFFFTVLASIFISACFVVYYIFFESGNVYNQISIGKTLPGDLSAAAVHDAGAVRLFSKAVARAEETEDFRYANETPDLYIVTHTDGRNETVYELFIKSTIQRDGYLYNTKTQTGYHLKAQDFTELLGKAEFSIAYGKEPPAPMLITTDAKKPVTAVYGYVKQADWNYAVPDARYENVRQENQNSNEFFLLEGNTAPLKLVVDGYPASLTVKIFQNGQQISEQVQESLEIPNPGSDGYYTYEIQMTWDPSIQNDYFGAVTYYFNVKFEISQGIAVSSSTALQGDVLQIRGRNIQEGDQARVYCEALQYESDLIETVDGYITLLPIASDAQPGAYTIKAQIGQTEYEATLSVAPAVFEKKEEDLPADETLAGVLERLKPYRSHTAFLTGSLSLPGTEITEKYGTEYANGRQKAVQITSSSQTAAAAEKGKVLISEKSENGWLVAIDHGLDILTYYYYLDETDLQTGDIVAKGFPVGSAQQFYYMVTVKGTPINPETFSETKEENTLE